MDNSMNSEMAPAPVKNHHIGPIIGAIVLLVVGGIVGYVLGNSESKVVSTETPTATESPIVSDWETYRDETYLFSVQYPPNTTLRGPQPVGPGNGQFRASFHYNNEDGLEPARLEIQTVSDGRSNVTY